MCFDARYVADGTFVAPKIKYKGDREIGEAHGDGSQKPRNLLDVLGFLPHFCVLIFLSP